MTDKDLSTALASRICHDLVSPIGAIANGIDLIQTIGNGNIEDELRMISQSAERASRVLQYYRIAFGAAADGSEIARAALAERADALITVKRVSLIWDDPSGPTVLRAHARLLLLMLLCAQGLVGMRGNIRVMMPPAHSLPMAVSVDGDGVFAEETMLNLLTGNTGDTDLQPQHVEFASLRAGAEAMGLTLSVNRDIHGTRMMIDDAR